MEVEGTQGWVPGWAESQVQERSAISVGSAKAGTTARMHGTCRGRGHYCVRAWALRVRPHLVLEREGVRQQLVAVVVQLLRPGDLLARLVQALKMDEDSSKYGVVP